MAKRITKNRMERAMSRIIGGESCLPKEACELGITLKDLDKRLKELYPGGNRNRTYKTIVENSGKFLKNLPQDVIDGYEKTLNQISEEEMEKAKPVDKKEETPQNPMLSLLTKAERAEKKCENCENAVKLAEEILRINTDLLEKSREVFEKAKESLEKQEVTVKTAKEDLDKALADQGKAKDALNKINKEIEELNAKTIYLIDPWYSDSLPDYGVFVSTIAIEGYKVEHADKEYFPELIDEDVFSFKATEDYRLAREFVGLVRKYREENKQHQLLIADERVKKMIERIS